jgi:hypothetical protein
MRDGGTSERNVTAELGWLSMLAGMLDEPANPCLLLTGLPRGGTTLACELLNEVADVYALDEPLDVQSLVQRATLGKASEGAPRRWAELIASGIREFALTQRRSIGERGVALTKHVDGYVRGAKVTDTRGADGFRVRLVERGTVQVPRPCSPDFTLAIKHPVLFTALLEDLQRHFPVFAVVRNPLSVLASWDTITMALREGKPKLLDVLAPGIARELAETGDVLERRVRLLLWFFEAYATLLPPERVLRYEDIVSSAGSALRVVAPAAAGLRVELVNRNAAAVYDRTHLRTLARLLQCEGAHWHYYTPEDVEEVLAAMTQSHRAPAVPLARAGNAPRQP